jgi:hypothetical protein
VSDCTQIIGVHVFPVVSAAWPRLEIMPPSRRRQLQLRRIPFMMRSIAFVLASGLLAACSSTEVVAPTMNVSVGQQLIDLKKAKDSGALSEKEWEQQKKTLIDSVR